MQRSQLPSRASDNAKFRRQEAGITTSALSADGGMAGEKRPSLLGRLANAWLRLTSSGGGVSPKTFAEREFTRRSQLASWLFLGLLVAGVAFLTAGQSDIPTLIAIVGAIASVIVACLLNRFGQVTIAALIVILVLTVAVFGADLSAPGGQLAPDYLASYDVLVLPVLIAAALLPPITAFVLVVINSILIVVDFVLLQPHTAELNHELNIDGLGLLLGRPIALEIASAAIVFLLVRGIIENARRADRAEELAALEGAIADQKRQLDVGVEQLLMAHTRAANGDYSVRVNLGQSNSLWVVGQSLNNMMTRLQKAGQAEYQLRRTDEELRRLAAAIDDARSGRPPLWPAPSGTVADEILLRINPAARQINPQASPQVFSDPGRPTQLGRLGQPGQMGQMGQIGQVGQQAQYGYGQGQYQGQPMQSGPNSGPGQRSPYGYGQPGQSSDPYQSHLYNQPNQPHSQAYPRSPLTPQTGDLRGGFPQGYYDDAGQEAPMDGYDISQDPWAYPDDQERRR